MTKRQYGLFAGSLLAVLFFICQSIACTATAPTEKFNKTGNAYYVAKNGSDSNSGTQAQPWLTIQKAARTMVAGDTVYVRAGTYNEKVVPANSGTSGNYITYKVYPGDTVTIDGTGQSFNNDGLFSINGHSYIEVNGFKIIKSPSGGVMVYGASNYVILRNLTIGGSVANKLQWSGIHALYDWKEPPARAITNLLIDSCDVSYTNYNAYDEGISLRYVTNFEIKNSTVHDILGDDSQVMNFNRKEAICPKLGSSNGSIHNNTVYNAKVGIYVGTGWRDASNIAVHDNTIHDCYSVTGSNPSGGAGIGFANEKAGYSATGFSFYNNTIYNCKAGGMKIGDQNGTYGFTLINNTFYNNGADREIFLTYQSGIIYAYCLIENNILYGIGKYHYLLNNEAPSGITIDHNLFYNPDGYDGVSNSYGTNYVVGKDPLFVNPNTADFHLQSSSPAIDGGTSAGAPIYDNAGTPRPQGFVYDIGAYEYPNPPREETDHD